MSQDAEALHFFEMSSNTENENWTTVIKPRNKLFEVNLKEIWDYRDLLTLFVKRTITVQYKQTILGPLWWIIQPMFTVIMYMVVFGGIAGIPTDGIPQPLFYLGGVALWQYFADCLGKTSSTFVSNAGIFGKVYFPRLIMPLSSVISNLVRFGIQLGLFIIVYVYYAIIGQAPSPNWYLLLFPLLVVMIAGLALGFGIIIYSPNRCPAGSNYTRYSNAKYDKLYRRAKQTSNEEERIALYREMDRMLMQDAPVVVLYYDQVLHFTHKNVHGLRSNAMNALDLRYVTIDKQKQ